MNHANNIGLQAAIKILEARRDLWLRLRMSAIRSLAIAELELCIYLIQKKAEE